MAISYYSLVLDHPADFVWGVIRDFGLYEWAGVQAPTSIEEGRAATEVGAVRRIEMGDRLIRQVLLAHSDVDRSFTYGFRGAPTIPVEDYEATVRVLPVVEDGRAFVEWRATFDCVLERRDAIAENLKGSFATWLGALRAYLAARR